MQTALLSQLPALNACLNLLAALFLILGYLRIRRDDFIGHRRCMVTALSFSALFLISYLAYHYSVGSVPYSRHDWTRPLYFAILIPHIVLAAVMGPFILAAVWHAWRKAFDKHKRLTRWVWPVWMFVSCSGVVIYIMLYHL